jgi:hypothetical protein
MTVCVTHVVLSSPVRAIADGVADSRHRQAPRRPLLRRRRHRGERARQDPRFRPALESASPVEPAPSRARPTLTQPARVDDRRCSSRSIFATLRLEAPNANSDSSQAWTTVFADSGPMTRAPRVRIWALLLFRARSAE